MNVHVTLEAPRREAVVSSTVGDMLRNLGLRPSRQRLVLVFLLFEHQYRRVSAESLYNDAQRARYSVSRATVINTLRQFTRAGLLRRVPIDGSRKAWFVPGPVIIATKDRRPSDRFNAKKLIEASRSVGR